MLKLRKCYVLVNIKCFTGSDGPSELTEMALSDIINPSVRQKACLEMEQK